MKKVSIALGGTGAGTPGGARTNLGSTTVGDALFIAASEAAAQQAISVEVGVDVQAFDATILVDADIGVSVQAFDATILIDADIGVSVQAFDATILVDADIGSTVQAEDATLTSIAALGTTSDKMIYSTGVDTWAETTLRTPARNLLDDVSISAMRTTLGLIIGTDVQAFDADTAKLDVVQVYTAAQRGGITTLSDGASISIDLSANNNFIVTLGGNRTLANATSVVAGQSGLIYVIQDGTGTRTLSYEPNYKFEGGEAPTLSTAANSNDALFYYAVNSTEILVSSGLAWI